MKRLCSVVAALLYSAAMAGAQSPEQLEQQLQELKQQYAETTRLMEQRIATLEQQIAAQRAAASAATKENTVSLAELVAEAEKSTSPAHSDQVGAKFQGTVSSEPTYDLRS